jgi:hypothetical protein
MQKAFICCVAADGLAGLGGRDGLPGLGRPELETRIFPDEYAHADEVNLYPPSPYPARAEPAPRLFL